MKSALALPLLRRTQLKLRTKKVASLLPAILRVDDLSSFLLSATNLEPKFLGSIKLPLVGFSSCRSTATATCTLATQPHHMVHQTRCITNVITPSQLKDRAMLTDQQITVFRLLSTSTRLLSLQ